ncbi:hypothetical protein EGR_08980 [Echinococcus granulosus]|uniref:Uncharacterized protein n=1 Tax=Echinococcus granulosus TaxID=6210 RepID=W6U4Y8_ECHGR|nr:hypothetical protein EGR_08980 [Echinococcus granulosus]EUB56175.1 hypothetical protein EGR_08980 [Echinococcus granulosus]
MIKSGRFFALTSNVAASQMELFNYFHVAITSCQFYRRESKSRRGEKGKGGKAVVATAAVRGETDNTQATSVATYCDPFQLRRYILRLVNPNSSSSVQRFALSHTQVQHCVLHGSK